MSLLESHLEQIMLSSNAIAELPFPQPRIFTNALLGSHDITALIRDTEAHERALFQSDPSVKASNSQKRATRRATQFQPESEMESMASRIYSARSSRNNSAVARVLGSDMMDEIKRSARTSTNGSRGEVNIDVLLKGAEILCNVYPVAGAQDKIASLRYRNQVISESIAELEERVARNASELESMSHLHDDDYDELDNAGSPSARVLDVTDADIERELKEIRELERRKRNLEDRVNGMERDLGSLSHARDIRAVTDIFFTQQERWEIRRLRQAALLLQSERGTTHQQLRHIHQIEMAEKSPFSGNSAGRGILAIVVATFKSMLIAISAA